MVFNMKKLKFNAAVIWYNPNRAAIEQLKILSNVFDKVYVYDNSKYSNRSNIIDYDNIQYFYNGQNEGISIALNNVIYRCCDADFLFAVDQDTEIKEKQIFELKKYIVQNYSDDIAIYCPYIFFNFARSFKKRVETVKFTITSCSMINTSIFKKIGGYDNNIFLDGVDHEYCFRVNSYGYKIIRLNYIKVKQNLGTGKKNIFGSYIHSPIRNYYIFYNRMYFINKYPNYFYGKRKIKKLYLAEIKQALGILLSEDEKKEKLKLLLQARKDYFKKDKRKD